VRTLAKKFSGFGGWPVIAAIFLAVVVGTILLKSCGYSPATAWRRMFEGSIGISSGWKFSDGIGSLVSRPVRLGNSINEAVPLIIVGLALAIPFRCGLINLGGNGQILVGGLGAALVGLFVPCSSPVMMIPLCLVAGAIFGAAWAVLPAILKVTRCMDEIITTIMFNYIAFWFVAYLVGGPICDKSANLGGYPWTVEMPDCTNLPFVWKLGRVHLGIVFAILATIVVHFLMRRSVLGFRMEVAGAGREAAEFMGYPVGKLQVMSMLFSGAFAGIAGACLLVGVQKRLTSTLDSGFGFDAIAVLLMGRGNPIGIFFAGLFWGFFRTGSEAMEVSENIPESICRVIQASMLIFIIIFSGATLSGFLRKRRTLNNMESTDHAD
jgi:general nucleoside transport system permease protein